MPHRLQGRKQEQEEILDLLAAADAGRGRVVIVEGRQGMGKSALLAEARSEAERRGFTVATGDGRGDGAVVPLAPFLRALGEAPGAGASTARSAPVDDRRSWLIEQLWLVEQLPLLLSTGSDRGPVLVALDDIQCADPATLLALRLLPARLAPSRLGWVVTHRPGEGGAALDQLITMLEHDGAARVVLDPLDAGAVDALVTDVVGAPPGPDLSTLAEGADGIPALVIELAEGLREERGVAIEDGTAQLVADRLPGRLRALVADRLAALSPETGHVLEVAALLDGPFPVEELARVLDRPPSRLLPALDEALDSDLLRAAGPCLDFWCRLGRRAIAESVAEPIRAALQRQIRDRQGSSDDGGRGAGPRPVPARPRAATSAAGADGSLSEPLWALARRGQFRRAEERATAIIAADHPGRDDVVVALTVLALVSWHEGRLDEALDRARQAVDRAGPSEAGAASAGAADPRLTRLSMLADVGRLEEADRVVAALAGDAGRAGDPVWAAALAGVRARLALNAGNLDAAEGDAEAACTAATECAADLPLRAAGGVLVAAALRRGDLSRAAQHLADHRGRLDDAPPHAFSDRFQLLEAQLACAETGAARAVEILNPIYDDIDGHRALLVEEPGAAAWMVRTALRAGEPARAAVVAAAAAELAAANPGFVFLEAAAAHARGLLERDAAALSRVAIGYWRPWARASAAEDAGVALAAEGDRCGALAQFDQAMAAYQEAGAAGDVARLRSRLRGLGVRRRHWRQSARPVFGWASLTDTESNVAHLVAEGLTNRQVAGRMFLSPHTIDFHLRQIFRKLDIGSRVELARFVVEQDGEEAPTPSRAKV